MTLSPLLQANSIMVATQLASDGWKVRIAFWHSCELKGKKLCAPIVYSVDAHWRRGTQHDV